MTFEELYTIIEKKNKNLVNDPSVTLTPDSFKKALKLSYDTGHKEGLATGYEDGKNSMSVFENLFGKSKF